MRSLAEQCLLLLAFVMLFAFTAGAMPRDAVKRGPHGGCVKQSGAYLVELVWREDHLVVFILDAASHVLNTQEIRASVVPISQRFRISPPISLHRIGKELKSSQLPQRPLRTLVCIRLGDTRILAFFGKTDMLLE